MGNSRSTPSAVDEQRIRQILKRNQLGFLRSSIHTELLGAVRDALANPQGDKLDLEFAANQIIEALPEGKPTGPSKAEADFHRRDRDDVAHLYMQHTMELYDALSAFPSAAAVAVLGEECEARDDAFADARRLGKMERAIRKVYDNLDDRTRFVLTFHCRYLYLQSFCTERGTEFLQDIHDEFMNDGDFLEAHAQQFVSDPQLGPLAEACPLGEHLYEVLG